MEPESPEETEPLAPDAGVLEVSVFGSGYGESIVAHLGDGDWVVVDSCETSSGEPVATAYLESLGLDPSVCIRAVVISHWDDDHIRGMRSIVSTARSALLYCSLAQLPDELSALVATAESSLAGKGGPGVLELHGILTDLEARQKAGDATCLRPVIGNAVLWRRDLAPQCQVFALSPTAQTVAAAQSYLASFIAGPAQRRVRVFSDRNHASVAMWVEVGERRFLLGADLENPKSLGFPWREIASESMRPPGRAEVFKVPHHGSDDADEPEVWHRMLIDEPPVGLTAFRLSPRPRPAPEDIERLCGRTPHVFLAGSPVGRARYPAAVRKTLNDVAEDFRSATIRLGHIRFRSPIAANEWRTTLFANASPQCSSGESS